MSLVLEIVVSLLLINVTILMMWQISKTFIENYNILKIRQRMREVGDIEVLYHRDSLYIRNCSPLMGKIEKLLKKDVKLNKNLAVLKRETPLSEDAEYTFVNPEEVQENCYGIDDGDDIINNSDEEFFNSYDEFNSADFTNYESSNGTESGCA